MSFVKIRDKIFIEFLIYQVHSNRKLKTVQDTRMNSKFSRTRTHEYLNTSPTKKFHIFKSWIRMPEQSPPPLPPITGREV
jgi:hypothetical protein